MSPGAGTPDSSDRYVPLPTAGTDPPIDAFEALTLDQKEREVARQHEQDLAELAYYAAHAQEARKSMRALLADIEALHTNMERAINDRGFARQLVGRRLSDALNNYDDRARTLAYHLGEPYTRQVNAQSYDMKTQTVNVEFDVKPVV